MAHLNIDTAIKRYAEGDRSPEVMEVLNRESGGAFPPQAPDPAPVQPLTLERLRAWSQGRGFTCYGEEALGRILVRFRYSPGRDRPVDLSLSISGKNKNILKLELVGGKRVPAEHLVKALRLVNDWNQDMRWPRALVLQNYRTDWDEDEKPSEEDILAMEDTKSASLVLDHQLFFPEGIHQAGLRALIDDALASSWEFWEKAQKVGL